MLGTLTRYLRFMGYDTVSANNLGTAKPYEDSVLIDIAQKEHRVLLTRDQELARRGGDGAVYINSEDVRFQVHQLIQLGLIALQLKMNRCTICNTLLRQANPEEILRATYAPQPLDCYEFYWCSKCGKLYWMGSHSENFLRRLDEIILK